MEHTNYTFIADVHLGKLARLLRMMGFDTVYNNSFTNSQLTTIAFEQNRILLSRNIAIGKKTAARKFVILSEDPFEQWEQVVQNFHLLPLADPFSRCLVCNGRLISVEKQAVQDCVGKKTTAYYNEFWQCTNCCRIFWKGSHYKRMKNWITKITNE